MKKQEKVKKIFHFPDKCVDCKHQEQFGESVCWVCKISNSVNAEEVIITTTVNCK